MGNWEGRFGGWSHMALTEKGKEQAKTTGKRLEGMAFDQFFCSDLFRARQTAELVFPGHACVEDWRLREIHVGECLEGRLREECFRQYGGDLKRAVAARDYTRYGGEDSATQLKRVAEFLESLNEFPDSAEIAAVCHAGTVFSMLCHVLQAEIDQKTVLLENASVSCFRRKNNKWQLAGWNYS